MSPEDENNEKAVQDIENESEENGDINSSSELEKEKQKKNEFNVEGNTALFQVFIQNLNEYERGRGIRQILRDAPSDENRKKFDLCEERECVEFIETYRDSEYVAVAIILCLFELVPLTELPDLRREFIEYLPRAEQASQEGNAQNLNGDPYLSIDTLINVIGGKRFVTEDGQSCIGLGDNSKQALVNVMNSFPALRGFIISGLVHVREVYKCRTDFEKYQMAAAFARVISLDMEYGDEHIFPHLYSDPGNMELLVNIMYILYIDEETRKNTQDILLQWLKSDNKWLWKTVCIIFVLLKEAGNEVKFEKALEKALCRRMWDFKAAELMFLASILMQSADFREMAAGIFHSLFNETSKQEDKQFLALIYLRLIRYCYFRVNKSSIELPLVVCDTGTQQKLLSPLLRQLVFVYHLRKQLYMILEAYIKEISDYRISAALINHMAAYFYIIAGTGEIYRQDIMDFLCRCEGSAARQIHDRLQKVYDRKKEQQRWINSKTS